MKTLLNILAGLIFIMLLSSCSVYQHVSISGDIPQNDHSEFIVENDSISIIYSFHGQGGSLAIDLFNKLDKPLYVDWRKSALIIGDQSFTLWKDEASINGVVQSIGNVEGTIVKNEKISFIPPYSKIVVNSYTLNPPFFNIPKQQGEKITFYTHNGDQRTGRKYNFTSDDSPYIFRIFLSICTDDSFKNPFQLDNSFWVSDYISTSAGPQEFDVYFGNQFYTMKESSAGKKIIGGALLSAIVVATAASGSPAN